MKTVCLPPLGVCARPCERRHICFSQTQRGQSLHVVGFRAEDPVGFFVFFLYASGEEKRRAPLFCAANCQRQIAFLFVSRLLGTCCTLLCLVSVYLLKG